MARSKDIFAELLQSDDFAGHIIRWVAIFESRLDSLLSIYFVGMRVDFEFEELVLSRVSFYEKIEILRKIEFGRPLKSQANIVNSLDKLRRLRNALAHTFYMPKEEIEKLRTDKWVEGFVLGYPKTVGREKSALENRFSLLWNHCYRRHIQRADAVGRKNEADSAPRTAVEARPIPPTESAALGVNKPRSRKINRK